MNAVLAVFTIFFIPENEGGYAFRLRRIFAFGSGHGFESFGLMPRGVYLILADKRSRFKSGRCKQVGRLKFG